MQGGTPVCDQATAVAVIFEKITFYDVGFGSTKGSLDKVVVEKRRPDRKLSLLQGKKTILIPRRLPKCGERDCVSLKYPAIGLFRKFDLRQQLGLEQTGSRISRFKRAKSP